MNPTGTHVNAPLFVLSCEHAAGTVPDRWRHVLTPDDPVLRTHEGYDIGALSVVQRLETITGVTCHLGEVTRLLIDLNRSPTNPRRWSRWSSALSADDQARLMARYHAPFWSQVYEAVADALTRDRLVVHLSVHSFTPELNGEVRDMDIGLLFDPAFDVETRFCSQWRQALKAGAPGLRVAFNRPYEGASDSITTALRQRLSQRQDYLALEIEINQRHPLGPEASWAALGATIAETFVATAMAQAAG